MPAGVLVAMGTAVYEPKVLQAIAEAPLHVVRRCVDIADLLATAASRQADVALISAELPGLDAQLVERVQAEGVFVVGIEPVGGSPDEALLRAFGIDDVVAADDLVTLIAVVVEVASHRRASAPSVPSPPDLAVADPTPNRAEVIAVWGPAGAPGRTTVAMGIAAASAARGCDTLLIDADVYGGATAIHLGVLDEISGLLAAAREANAGALAATTLAGHARSVAPGLRVLTGLPRADRWTEVKAVLMGRIIQAARYAAQLVVVDCGFSLERDEEVMYDTAAPRRNGATFEVLDRADAVVVVGAADPVGLSRLIRAGHEVAALRLDARQHVVVNRTRASLGWSRDEMTSTIRRSLGPVRLSCLPDDQPAVDRCVVHGRTLIEGARESRLTRAIEELVDELFPGGLGTGDDRTGRGRSEPGRRRRTGSVRTRRAARAR